jgi:hypothetical protein
MSLKKGYLSQKNEVIISKKRVIISLFLALGISIGLYSIISSIKLFGIILANDFDNNGAILISPENSHWQNFSFALVSFALGHSIFLMALFTKPLKFKFLEINRSRIVNNQVFLSFNFYWLFFKVFLLLLFIIAEEVFYHFKSYYFLFFLFALVLFLESWKTILLIFRKRAYKYMLIHSLLLVILSFLLAFNSIYNVSKVESYLNSVNPYIEIPVLKSENLVNIPNFRSYYGSNSIRVKLLNENNQITYLLDGQKHDDLNSLLEQIKEDRDQRRHFPFRVIKIYAPAKIQMAEINKIRRLAFKLFYSFGVEFVFSHSEFKTNDLSEILIRDWFDQVKKDEFEIYPDLPPPPTPPSIEIKNESLINVAIENEHYFINSKIVEGKDLESEFLKYINEYNFFHLVYSEDKTNYKQYLVVYLAYRNAVERLRNQAQKVELLSENFRYTNRTEYEEDQRRIKSLYPIRFIENDHRKINILDEN